MSQAFRRASTRSNLVHFNHGMTSVTHSFEVFRMIPPQLAQFHTSATKCSDEFTALQNHRQRSTQDDEESQREIHSQFSRGNLHSDLPAHLSFLKNVASAMDTGAESMSNGAHSLANSQKVPEESAAHSAARQAQIEVVAAHGMFSDVVKEMEDADGQITFFVSKMPPKDSKPSEVCRWIDSPECAVSMHNLLQSAAAAKAGVMQMIDRLGAAIALEETLDDEAPAAAGTGQRARALAILNSFPAMTVAAMAAFAVEPLYAVAREYDSATIADHYSTILAKLGEPPTDANLWALASGETDYWDTQPGLGKRVSAKARYAILVKCRDEGVAKMEPQTRKQWEDFLAEDRLKNPVSA